MNKKILRSLSRRSRKEISTVLYLLCKCLLPLLSFMRLQHTRSLHNPRHRHPIDAQVVTGVPDRVGAAMGLHDLEVARPGQGVALSAVRGET